MPPGGDGSQAPLSPQPGERRPVAVTQSAIAAEQRTVQIGDQESSVSFHKNESSCLYRLRSPRPGR